VKILPRSLTARVLLGLAAGLVLGVALSGVRHPVLAAIPAWVEPIGTLWVNALRMTVVPLVVSCLIAAVAGSRDTRAIRRVGGGALLVFILLLAGAAAFGLLAAPPLLSLLAIPPEAAAALRASAAGDAAAITAGAGQIPGFSRWLVDLVPTNAVKAAADGAMLPLIVFSLAFGLALTRARPMQRESLVHAVEGVADATLVLVRWILEVAPIGVFALAVPLADRLGLAAAGAVAYYIAVAAIVLALFIAALYPVAALFGRVPLRAFARASAPAQAVAFSSRSSLAALPAMIEGAEAHLRRPPEITGFLLPLAASTFRVGSAIGIPVGALFLARLYGVPLDAGQLITIGATSAILTFSIPGIPGGSILIMLPVLLAVGLPVEGIGILLGVDTVPDMFRTTANVTGDMTVATVIGRSSAPAAVAVPAAAAAPEPVAAGAAAPPAT
jgi:Na+/H+-dicarboxylate symporter